jgi:hypothetical protein
MARLLLPQLPDAVWDAHRTLMLVSYALVLVAFLPIGLSGEVGVAAPIAFLGAMGLSMLRDPRTSPPRPQTAKAWTAVVLLAFGGLIGWALQDGNWLLHALQFALLLTVSRFFQRRFAKDHLQLVALSFVLLLVAAILQPGPLFAVCFLVYTMLTMWGLTLLHLAREIEVQTHSGPSTCCRPHLRRAAGSGCGQPSQRRSRSAGQRRRCMPRRCRGGRGAWSVRAIWPRPRRCRWRCWLGLRCSSCCFRALAWASFVPRRAPPRVSSGFRKKPNSAASVPSRTTPKWC